MRINYNFVRIIIILEIFIVAQDNNQRDQWSAWTGLLYEIAEGSISWYPWGKR